MPTVLRIGPYRFFFYAGDGEEPPHIHVERDSATAKWWVVAVKLQRSRGFNRAELAEIERLVHIHAEELLESWYDYFDT